MASITITINGQKVPAQTGQTVLEAARAAGIDIPTLCHHPAVKPIGACRLCLVEIAGQRTLQPACTFPVADKMDVKTESPKVVEVRKFVMELIFSERNHFCMYCEMSGDCELQALAYKYGLDHMTYPTYVKGYPVDASPPYFLLDHNRCVLCRRCVRVCGELVANHTLDMRQRGASTMVHADMNLPLGQSSCIACGNCLDVCPTGALVDKRSAFMARNAQTEHVRSVCSQCSLGCGIDIVTRAGNLLRVQGDSEAPVNRGLLCRKGRFEPLYEKRTRLLAPLVRTRDGGHRQADWNEALQTAADRIRRTPAAKVGVLASTGATNEALYLLARLFVKELKAGQAGLSHPVAPVFSDKIPDRLEEIAKSDCVLVVGADPARDQPVASFFVKRALDAEGRVIVVGAPESALAELADESFGMEEIRKAVEAARAASRPAVLYGAGLRRGARRVEAPCRESAPSASPARGQYVRCREIRARPSRGSFWTRCALRSGGRGGFGGQDSRKDRQGHGLDRAGMLQIEPYGPGRRCAAHGRMGRAVRHAHQHGRAGSGGAGRDRSRWQLKARLGDPVAPGRAIGDQARGFAGGDRGAREPAAPMKGDGRWAR